MMRMTTGWKLGTTPVAGLRLNLENQEYGTHLFLAGMHHPQQDLLGVAFALVDGNTLYTVAVPHGAVFAFAHFGRITFGVWNERRAPDSGVFRLSQSPYRFGLSELSLAQMQILKDVPPNTERGTLYYDHELVFVGYDRPDGICDTAVAAAEAVITRSIEAPSAAALQPTKYPGLKIVS